MTGENFKRFSSGKDKKETKEKLLVLYDKMARMQNINNIRENGFDSDEHERLHIQVQKYKSLLEGR